MSSLSDNITQIQERMANAAVRAGRRPEEITLIAVTKTVPLERVQEAISAGISDFGENYIQEARTKIPEMRAFSEHTGISVQCHLIGHLQSNKAKYSVDLFDLIHSADNYQLVQEIDRQAAKRGKVQDILIEVNLTEMVTRTGVAWHDLGRLVEEVNALPNIALRGLMGIAPAVEMPELVRPYFARLRESWESLPALQRQVLSMGMSGDFEAAILEGATHIRIGSAIFGQRAPKT